MERFVAYKSQLPSSLSVASLSRPDMNNMLVWLATIEGEFIIWHVAITYSNSLIHRSESLFLSSPLFLTHHQRLFSWTHFTLCPHCLLVALIHLGPSLEQWTLFLLIPPPSPPVHLLCVHLRKEKGKDVALLAAPFDFTGFTMTICPRSTLNCCRGRERKMGPNWIVIYRTQLPVFGSLVLPFSVRTQMRFR